MFISRLLTKIAIVPALLLILAACSSIEVSDYAQNTPKLVAESFFDGQLRADGVVKDRSGKVIRYFTADIKAYWQDGVGTLEEDFVFDDGEKQRRVWTLTPNGDNRYIGTAGDVIGESEVQLAGNSMFLDYVLRIPYGDGTIDIAIDDRMYWVSPNILINESSMSKFGVHVGQLLLVIQKLE
ncbi:DUF3833 domain-containing protein [Oceanicoccus sagamiensis]|uniref:DUF3833 domain-containing protein n=1 Tax=Oceanicoccus sagamiensis TaxID=716816 RepID=A0A1X9NMD3_9GAMM|nr:DUF3833 domain-containing protein [Oceanicoccus sagamiensis]ARN75073.1 hypothetical protein BST96_13685 [Oceanicoccus sagamiensis]